MFVEIRKQGKRKKYYLAHTYRIGNRVERISRYLGADLDISSLEKLKNRAIELITAKLNEDLFDLTPEQLALYKKFDEKIEIKHLQGVNWQQFTEVFTYNTNAIEGSTVSYPTVKEILEKDKKPADSDEIETFQAASAVEFIRKSTEKITVNFILKLHKLCFMGTKSFAGKLRTVEVVIKDKYGTIVHTGTPHKDVRKLLHSLCMWYEKHTNYPALYLAAIVHNQFEKIHPFQDGNGRVGRLLLNYVLISKKYPPVNIRIQDRARYYRCLQSFDSKSDIKSTLRFLIYQYKKLYR